MKKIINLPASEVKDFFMQGSSYCNVVLPEYFTFNKMLEKVDKLSDEQLLPKVVEKAKECDNTNYIFYRNKDNKYSWRKLQLINPYIYVSLVRYITKEENWGFICNRINTMRKNKRIKVHSDIVKTDKKDDIKSKFNKASTILTFSKMEKEFVKEALEYKYIGKADIAGFYDSIYTHSIAWAFHDKEYIKKKENMHNDELIGNVIDKYFSSMNFGQTIGIPQGSVLSDFIAEIVLSYVDLNVGKALKGKISNYKIHRYRDDYFIFSNSIQDVEDVIKTIAEELQKMSLRINESKVGVYDDIIENAFKKEKIESIKLKLIKAKDIYDKMLIIREFSSKNKNSGQLISILNDYYEEIEKLNKIPNYEGIISMIVDIMLDNNKVYVNCCAIISNILEKHPSSRTKLINKIYNKIDKYANNDEIQIWLQRICLNDDKKFEFKLDLCKAVNGEKIEIWSDNWLKINSNKKVKNNNYIDYKTKKNMSNIIAKEKRDAFDGYFDK